MNKIDELIAFHLRAAESCEAFAVTPDADKAKIKDIAKHYQKTAAWHREAVEALRGLAAPIGESLFERGKRLFREGYGPSSLWGECKSDSELPEVHRGWNAAYDADALKPVEGEGS